MTSLNNQYRYCKKCTHRDFNPSEGILCGITKQKPNFGNTCGDFVSDPALEVVIDETGNTNTDTILYTNSHGVKRLALKENEKYAYGLTAGIFAGVIGAVIWYVLTLATGYHIGQIALLIGAGIGLAVGYFGKGVSPKFAITGAIITLLSCLIGHFFSIFMYLGKHENMSLIDVFRYLHKDEILTIYIDSFSTFSLILYAVATVEGFKFAKFTSLKDIPFLNPDKNKNKRRFLNRD